MTGADLTELDDRRRASRRLWVGATVAALALHLAGAALALASLRSDEADDDLGAPAIEIGLEMSSPRQDPSDLPPGPDSDASLASPPMPEQKADLKQEDLPQETPRETDDPDKVVTANAVKEPVEEAKAARVQSSASQASVAAEAMAAPSSQNSPQADRSTAPAQGIGDSVRRARMTWEKELVAHLDRHKRYPADRTQKSAELLVSFALDRMGHVLSARIVKGSGDPAFDDAALAMVRRSDPVPQPPPGVADDGLSFTVPVFFRVKGKS